MICNRFIPILMLLFLTACATNQVQYRNFDRSDADLVTGWLSKPDGDGPFPAIILLHGCSGLGRDESGVPFKGIRAHQDAFNNAGFVTLIVDSWGSRGVSTAQAYKTKCTGQFFAERHVDLSGAIRYLKTLPYVKPKIGAVGLSQGGRTVVEASGWKKSELRTQLLSAAVGIYPSCGTAPNDVRIPLLILIGDADLITKSSICQRWLNKYEKEIDERLDENGNRIGILPELVVYPDVYHAYDLPIVGEVLTPVGTVKADRKALKDTRKRMIAFFKKHLGS